jgi:1,4-dihydroxy-2-naphthoate octaprenyltransferase
LVGLTTTIILFCSHFHQIEGDKAAGKMSPLVRLGTDRAVKVLKVATGAPFLGILVAVGLSLLQGNATAIPGSGALMAPWTLAPALLLSLPAAKALLSFAEANHTVPAAIAPLKIFATKLHMSFGMTLICGLALGRCCV